ncbi:UrcA family protein [Altererythrobacter indicus]|uniref:UrcA family protein n=1 Tax=Altericroceibacterium indicum TaxID=374177 RepID=A0A845AD31_9SPHN|nr:UrcA family protein [Altericroceibacterium indicum]MXP26446.1 UrcA family protein [Altericroceibacterium indicum]
MKIHSLILAAAAAATVFATPAMARPAAFVKVTDLQLTTAEGQAELQKRLNKAAHKVCLYDSRGQLNTPAQESACFRQTRKDVQVLVAELTSKEKLGG